MKVVDPKDIPTPQLHQYLLGAIAPRPIAFVSTVDKQGQVNLSPYSFFNVFSANPPIVIFSPARRGRDNTTKHTYENVLEHPECVVNIVSYSMVQQMSLASTEYDKGVNEFVKAGFTEAASGKVKPPRVAESPASFECTVREVIPLGDQGGAGNLVVGEIVLAHFHEAIFDDAGNISPQQLDAVARLGGNWYCRANGDALFEVEKPLQKKGIGVDSLPEQIRLSEVLSGNDLGKLGNVERLPNDQEIISMSTHQAVQQALQEAEPGQRQVQLHQIAKKLLARGETMQAWAVLLQEKGL